MTDLRNPPQTLVARIVEAVVNSPSDRVEDAVRLVLRMAADAMSADTPQIDVNR